MLNLIIFKGELASKGGILNDEMVVPRDRIHLN